MNWPFILCLSITHGLKEINDASSIVDSWHWEINVTIVFSDRFFLNGFKINNKWSYEHLHIHSYQIQICYVAVRVWTRFTCKYKYTYLYFPSNFNIRTIAEWYLSIYYIVYEMWTFHNWFVSSFTKNIDHRNSPYHTYTLLMLNKLATIIAFVSLMSE